MTKKLVSNILNEEEYKKIANLTIDTISETLMKSLGYYGSTTIFDDGVRHNVSKDGYNILKNIRFQDTVANSILGFIKDVSLSLVKTVGDGSTSSVINSQKMFKLLDEKLNSQSENGLGHYSRKEVGDSLIKMKNIISERLKDKAIHIDKDNFEALKDIASVSNNNDDELGKLIYEIFEQVGHKGFIFPELSDNEKDHYTLTRGIETKNTLVDSIFVNDQENYAIDYDNPYYLIVNKKLDKKDIEWVFNLVTAVQPTKGKGLVIVSPGTTLEFRNFIKNNVNANRHQGGLKATEGDIELALAEYSSDDEDLKDLAIYTKGKIVDKNMDPDKFYEEITSRLENSRPGSTISLEAKMFINEYLGESEKLIIDNYKTQIIQGEGIGTRELDDRITEINSEIKYHANQDSDKALMTITKLQRRVNSLNTAMAKLYVGGSSYAEKETRMYLVEDSVYASKSALEHGYVSGGNLAVSKVIKDLLKEDFSEMDKTVLSIIDNSARAVYENVLKNYSRMSEEEIKETVQKCINDDSIYNIKSEQYEDDENTSIINSVETDIKILESTISIISLIALSNQFLTKNILV